MQTRKSSLRSKLKIAYTKFEEKMQEEINEFRKKMVEKNSNIMMIMTTTMIMIDSNIMIDEESEK